MSDLLKRVECPEPVEGLSFIYILYCRNETFYVGQSVNVRERIKRHQNGSGAKHTQQLKEFTLVYTEGPMHLDAAI
ncbi:MAG: GIY-YIG nuclease family protein [Verrucomicrobiota bacterium]